MFMGWSVNFVPGKMSPKLLFIFKPRIKLLRFLYCAEGGVKENVRKS